MKLLKHVAHLVTFDIDGTLVASAGFDGELYEQAVREILGVDINDNWGDYQHITDSGILRELLDLANIAGDRKAVERRVRERFVALTQAYVAARPGALQEVPGAKALLEALCETPEISVAVATGGWRETALLKLRGIGLDPARLPIATGSDAIERTEIMRIAEQRAIGRTSVKSKTLFGDGIWDLKAAEALGYRFVAVGDGVEHHSAFSDLQDLDSIIEHICDRR